MIHVLLKILWIIIFDNLINNPKMFNGVRDDLAAKPYIPQKKILQ